MKPSLTVLPIASIAVALEDSESGTFGERGGDEASGLGGNVRGSGPLSLPSGDGMV